MPDLGQVAELDPGIMALGLESVIALLDGDGIDGHRQFFSTDPQPPGAVPARRIMPVGDGEGEAGAVPVPVDLGSGGRSAGTGPGGMNHIRSGS
jgi:hypothetical protein